jgi:DivIVA domain-containing protein
MAKKKRKKEEAQAAGFGQAQGRSRLTPVDVQEKVFRLSAPLTRGYNEQDVDEFLDRITEELAHLHEENKRLREKVDEGGGGRPESVAQADAQAAEIVRQAREHAARLMADAGQATGAPAPPAGFLIRERDFLQQMAALIQSHAEALKADARRGKTQEASGSAPAAPPEPDPAPEAETPPQAAATAGAAGVAPGWEGEATQAHDPLLDEWEEGVAPQGEPYQSSDLFGGSSPEEPESEDLRELFWGEDA